jgi:hypothetical protein
MYSFFSTPLLRLLTILVIVSILFPIIGFSFSRKTFGAESSQPALRLLPDKLLKQQVEFLKQRGISFDETTAKSESGGAGSQETKNAQAKIRPSSIRPKLNLRR